MLLASTQPRDTIEASRPVGRRLVGDYEPADSYVVALSAGWPRTYPPLLDALAAEAPVSVFVQAGAGVRAARRFVDGLPERTRSQITLLSGSVDSPWVRDYGPLQVREPDGTLTWLDALYLERPRDDQVPSRLAAAWSTPLEALPISLDGGAISSDGRGHCISTSDYLDTHGIDRGGLPLRSEILPALGCATLLLVPALLEEDTGHVDMFLQFLDATTVGVSSIDPELDPDQSARLDEIATRLQTFAERHGLHWTLVRVPMGMDLGGDLFPYINGVRLPTTFLMPSYSQNPSPSELLAADALRAAMPGVAVVRIPTAQMADLGGALHCAVLGIRRAAAPAEQGGHRSPPASPGVRDTKDTTASTALRHDGTMPQETLHARDPSNRSRDAARADLVQ